MSPADLIRILKTVKGWLVVVGEGSGGNKGWMGGMVRKQKMQR